MSGAIGHVLSGQTKEMDAGDYTSVHRQWRAAQATYEAHIAKLREARDAEGPHSHSYVGDDALYAKELSAWRARRTLATELLADLGEDQ